MTGMPDLPEPSEKRRPLGRSRAYVRADVPARLFQWHAPRANRWEHLCVEAGALEIEWLREDGVRQDKLASGETRWIAPGMRWRIARMEDEARFVFDIHADEAIEPSAPQPRRARLLDACPEVTIGSENALATSLNALRPGGRLLVRADFDFTAAFQSLAAASAGTLCWHPLELSDGGLVALVSRADRPIDLLEYLGRDHAVIEAALTGAQQGDAERLRWLRNTLARHLVIEEELLFPAYLDAGGSVGWVNGLRKEHGMLKRQLGELADPDVQRRFLLLLEAHDEKEEQIVYPDIVARIDEAALEPLLFRVITLSAMA